MGVSAAMIVGGFGLETFTEVAEEGIAQPEKKEGETDIFRDSLLRYCGYANEVGEAFRPLVPVAVVYVSYVIAITYILADTVDKGKKGADNGGLLTGGLGAIDTFCWQMLASVLFPSFIINRVVLLLVSLGAEGSLPDLLSAGWVPTAAGLILIPLIILPLDVLAHFTMNGSYRRIGNAVLEE
jgi:fission process protein 1